MTYTFEEFHKKLTEEGYQPSDIENFVDDGSALSFWVHGIRVKFIEWFISFDFGMYSVHTNETIEVDFLDGIVMVSLGKAHFNIHK